MRTLLQAARLTLLSAAVVFLPLTGVQKLGAQTETGQITGTVVDAQGGAVNATVTAVDTQTKSTRTGKTASGVYSFPSLLPGTYEVTAAAPGFETIKRTVTVNVGTKVGVDFHLTVGNVQTVVEVSELATRINTETQTVGSNITGDEIVNLPTLTRNPYDLVKTVGNTTDADPDGSARGVGVSMNGLRSSDVGILLDGVPNNNNFDTKVGIQTPLDSVGEINVITNSPTAEYGRALAGFVNVDTKRGTNAIHGSVYEFNRVSALTSNTFDNNANGIPISPFTRNQFGFSIGAPIKKDKLFVFGNPEWIRVRSVGTVTDVVATPQLIAASAPATQSFFNTYGRLKSDLTPLQTFTAGQVCTSGACLALPANTPIYQKVAFKVGSDSGGGNPQNTLWFAGRIDYNYSDKTQFYFRYARVDTDYAIGTQTNSAYVGYDTADYLAKNSLALSGTHIFSPTFISQTKLSFNRFGDTQPLSTAPVGPTLYTTLSATTSLGGSPITYPGYSPTTPGNSIPFGGPQNYYQVNQDFTKQKGVHNFRFGGLYTLLNDNRTFGAYAEAVSALGTNQNSALNGLLTGTLHDFQAAIYPQGKFPCHNNAAGAIVTPDCTLTLPVGPPNFSRSNLVHEAALYVQDSWKVKPRLTVNLGLRWEYFGPQSNRDQNLDSNFFFGPGSNIETQSGTGQLFVSTDPKNPLGGLWKKDWKDFEPRIGIAYDLFGDGKTALRGGYGMGFIPNFGNVTFNVIQNPPTYAVIALTAGSDVPTIPITNSNAGPLAGSGGTKAFGRATLRAVDPNISTAYAQLWSASLEHQFTNDFLMALEYSGSKGSNLYSINRLNIPGSALLYGGTGTATTRINDQYSYINFRTNGGFSNYNGLNVRGELRNFRRQGVTLRANYTWSHAIDNISNTFSDQTTGSGNLGVLDPLHPELDKGNAEYDVRHRFSLAGTWEVPFKSKSRAMNAAIGGWTLNGNFSARTGTPFSVFDCTHQTYVFCPRVMYNTPYTPTYNVVSTGAPNEFSYVNIGTPNSSYVNALTGVSDFGPFPPTMTGRDIFTEPGNWNVDFSIHKNFSLTERFKLQLRGEAFNVFNHSNLWIVNSSTDISSTPVTAKKGIRADNNATTIAPENRNLQLAVKLIF